MATLIFDKLKFFKTLNSNGFTDQQADSLTTALQDSLEESQNELVTKKDLKHDLTVLQHNLERFMVKSMAGVVGVLGALVGILHLVK